jgi:two-component sensor histidine kinase
MLCLEEDRLSSEEDRRIFEAVGMRIQAMSLVHQKLYQSGDLSRIELRGYIESLCALVRESSGVEEEKIAFDFTEMERVEVMIDTAMPLGIVLNELLSNAFIHAFPGDKKGRISISLHRGEEGEVRLRFSDDGVGFDAGTNPRERGRMGFMLIFQLVTLQLGGQLACSARRGTAWDIRFFENRYQQRV